MRLVFEITIRLHTIGKRVIGLARIRDRGTAEGYLQNFVILQNTTSMRSSGAHVEEAKGPGYPLQRRGFVKREEN